MFTLNKDERGAALIEFALSSMIFLTVLFGILDFGQAVWRYNMTADLAQEGARWASAHGAGSAIPASAAQVQSYVQARSPGITVTVTTTSAGSSSPYACTSTSVSPSTLTTGDGVCVTVQAAYSRVTSLIPIPSLTLQSRAQMIVFR